MNAETLRKVVARDPAALNGFFDHYFDRVYTHVTYLTGDPVLAEDLVQDVFIRLQQTIDRLDPERDPSGWVFTVATNTVRDHWRSKQHRKSTQEIDIEKVADSSLADGQPTPDQDLEHRQAETRVREALLTLAEIDREVLLLRTYGELETAEVARILNITPDAVRQRHSRAVGRLREAVKKVTEHHQVRE